MRNICERLLLVMIATALVFSMVSNLPARARHQNLRFEHGQEAFRGGRKSRHRRLLHRKPKSEDARALFGAVELPSDQPSRSIGGPVLGCLAGAQRVPENGPHWQVMRLSRNRFWGHPTVIKFIERLSENAFAALGATSWTGLLVGDIAQPRGGPMLSGHASHQIGIDTDIWFLPMPDHLLTPEERETLNSVDVLTTGTNKLDPQVWNLQRAQLVSTAAKDPAVDRIFVTPAIKQALCNARSPDGTDTEWLRKIRPYYGHNYHFHVRLHCPQGEPCVEQKPPPSGDGCGLEVDEWLKKTADVALPPSAEDHPRPKKPISLSRLPAACGGVLKAKERTDQ